MKIMNSKYTMDFKKISRNITFMFIVLALFGILNSISMGKRELITKSVVVENEDTIWNIAKDICTQNDDKDLNLQNVIIEIKDMNNLSSSQIYEGQVLNIPVY